MLSLKRLLLPAAFLLLGAYTLRIYRLDYQSIWWDEGISLHLATSSLAEIARDRLDNIHPPLYFFLLKGWLALVGVSPFTGRYLSVLAGLTQVAVVFTAVRHWSRETSGARGLLPWLGAGLALLSPLSVIYSQEIRVYALLSPLYVAMLLAGGLFLDSRGRRLVPLIVLGGLEWLGLHLHYIALFACLYVGLWGTITLLRQRNGSALRRWFIVQGLVIVACLPWFATVVRNVAAVQGEANAGTFMAEAVPPAFLVAQVWAFHLTGLAGSLASRFVQIGAVLTALVVFWLLGQRVAAALSARSSGRQDRATLRLAAHWLLPLALALLLWNVRSFSHPRYVIMFAGMFIPLAVLLLGPWRSWLNRGAALLLAACLLGLSGWGLQTYFFGPGAAKPNMRGVARFLEANAGPDDLIIIPDTDWSLVFEYEGAAEVIMPRLDDSPQDGQSTLASVLDCSESPCARSGRVFVVDYTRGTRDWQARLPFELARRGYVHQETAFDDLLVREYRLTRQAGPLPACGAPEMTRPALRFGPLVLESVWAAEGAAADTAVAVALCWQLAETPHENFVASLILTDPVTGDLLAQSDTLLVGPLGQPTSLWLPGDTVTTFHQLSLPAGTPPIEAALAMGLYPQAEGAVELVEASDAKGRVAGRIMPVGEVALSSPAREATGEELAALSIWAEAVEVDPGLELLGARFDPGPYRPGQNIRVSLVWRATAEGLPDFHPALVLRQGSDILAENDTAPVNGRHPTSRWREGEVILEQRDVRIPPGAEGTATLTIQSTARADLGEVAIDPGDLLFDKPPATNPVSAAFVEQIALIGFDLSQAPISSAVPVAVTLYWQALSGEIGESYTVFVHLLAPDGRVIAQHDGLPAGGGRPTNEWLLGEYVIDRHELEWREPDYTGPARIIAGLYDPATGERLLTAEGADHFLLPAEVAVTAGP